jgi:hypothetical protein
MVKWLQYEPFWTVLAVSTCNDTITSDSSSDLRYLNFHHVDTQPLPLFLKNRVENCSAGGSGYALQVG